MSSLPENCRSLFSLFPLIDDSANIFYSKLKTLFFSTATNRPIVERISRIRYRVTFNSSNGYAIKGTINLNDPDLKTEVQQAGNTPIYLYVRVYFYTTLRSTQEITTTGEVIPVDEKKIYASGSFQSFDYNTLVRTTPITDEDVCLIDSQRDTEAYLLVGRLHLWNQLVVLEPTFPYADYKETTQYPLTFETLYKPDIGRKWVVTKSPYRWDMYSIDTDGNEYLIDSSDTQFSVEGSLGGLPAQPSPYRDHQVKLTFASSSLGGNVVTFSCIEQEYFNFLYPSESGKAHIVCREKTGYALNTNHNPENLKLCLNSISMRISHGDAIPTREHYILALSYLLGVDIRFFIEPRTSDLFAYYTDTSTSEDIYFNGMATVIDADLLNDSLFTQSIFNQYPTIPSTDFTFPNVSALEATHKNVPLVQNALGFSKQVYTSRFREGNKVFLESLRKALWETYCFSFGFWSPKKEVKTWGDLLSFTILITSETEAGENFPNSYLGYHSDLG